MTTIFTHKSRVERPQVKLRTIQDQDAPVLHRPLQDSEAAISTVSVHSGSQRRLPWSIDEPRCSSLVLAVIDKARNAMTGTS
ncbi:hypothetical protein BJ956_001632 [Arthrobacter psychrochitiniphilus]|uniref:Uncharacterized protein n=1 Tax=Arthrobacter psychrochitiniphilus TaxID=291045 RepID=A0A2V3DRG2_9MICC|nr:hypothetical protein [Arthrobacter psychrochitiniphilus]PXA65574.1 hypothetical protein CVS29_10145 [Arthrobacter psychrochitiniphilus]